MKGTKQYRFKDNPKEKELHDKFIEMMSSDLSSHDMLSSIVFGWKNERQNTPKQYITEEQQTICVNLIQWLGSPVGQGFLRNCGFELNEKI